MLVWAASNAFSGPFFHEAVLQVDRPVNDVLEALADAGICGGFDLSESFPELGNALLVCATETRNAADINLYARELKRILKGARAA